MSATTERDHVVQIASGNFPKALILARKVSAPWFQCQALAEVARFAPDNEVVLIAREALKTALAEQDVYRRVAACAWPLGALAERGKTQEATRLISELLSRAEEIRHPVNRLDALLLLWRGAIPLPFVVRQPLLTALLAAGTSANSWKAGRALRDVALSLAQSNAGKAQQVIDAMPDGYYKRQTQRRLVTGRFQEIGTFFWQRPS